MPVTPAGSTTYEQAATLLATVVGRVWVCALCSECSECSECSGGFAGVAHRSAGLSVTYEDVAAGVGLVCMMCMMCGVRRWDVVCSTIKNTHTLPHRIRRDMAGSVCGG